MALHQLTEAELDAVTGGFIRQRNVSVQLAANVAVRSNVSTTATASGKYSDATATGGQTIVQDSSQTNDVF